MPQEITITTPEHVELKFELAGIGSRFLALLLDMLIQAGVLIVFGLIVFGVTVSIAHTPIEKTSNWLIAILVLLLFAFTNGYFLYFETAKNGQTPGKKSVGIRVIRDTGHPVDFRAGLLRNIMRAVDSLPGVYSVGFITMFLSPQYKRLGDYVAGTLVVRTGRQNAVVQPVPQPAQTQVTAPSPEIPDMLANAPLLPDEALIHLSSVTKDDYRAVRLFLDRRLELNPDVVRSLTEKLAWPLAQKLQINPGEYGLTPMTFLENLCREWERRMVH